MVALIEEEGLDENGLPRKHQSAHHQRKCKRKQGKNRGVQGEGEDEDSDFLSSSSGNSDSDGSESDLNGSDGMIPNDEVYPSLCIEIYSMLSVSFLFFQIADMLPSKTAPQTKSKTCSQQKSTMHAKKKSHKTTVEEVEDEDSPQNISAHNHAASSRSSYRTEKKSVYFNTLSYFTYLICISERQGETE